MPNRAAPADHPLAPLIANRWSPRAFTDAPVTAAEAASLFEAARWAASCNNEQPWLFIAAHRDSEAELFGQIFHCLSPNNQGWAGRAGLLVLGIARLTYAANGNPNAMALYDLGQAAAQMSLQALSMGIYTHQMRGFDTAAARTTFAIPAGQDPAVVLAFGRLGDPATLPAMLAEREAAPRTRKPQAEFVRHGPFA